MQLEKPTWHDLESEAYKHLDAVAIVLVHVFSVPEYSAAKFNKRKKKREEYMLTFTGAEAFRSPGRMNQAHLG